MKSTVQTCVPTVRREAFEGQNISFVVRCVLDASRNMIIGMNYTFKFSMEITTVLGQPGIKIWSIWTKNGKVSWPATTLLG